MAGRRPIRNGAVVTDETGTILGIGRVDEMDLPGDTRWHHQVLMPGLINAHIHATDAILKSPVSGGEGLVPWVSTLLARRNDLRSQLDKDTFEQAVSSTMVGMARLGTVAVGEVANDYSTLKAVGGSGMQVRFMHEALGWRESAGPGIDELMENERRSHTWGGGVEHAFALHAPYSTSHVLAASLRERSLATHTNLYIHLAEDIEERRLYVTGDGAWRVYLEQRGVWDDTWKPPGMEPIPFYDAIGIIDDRFVAVHLADATIHEIALLARRGARAILSPRSNAHITGLVPDADSMVRAGLPFAFGTDGHGSNSSIDVMDEGRAIADRFPFLPPGTIMEGLTWNGAVVLGFPALGRITPGATPGLLSLELDEVPDSYREIERSILFDCRRRSVAVPAASRSTINHAS